MMIREPFESRKSKAVLAALVHRGFDVVEVLETPGCDCCGHYSVTLRGDMKPRFAGMVFGYLSLDGFGNKPENLIDCRRFFTDEYMEGK